MTDYGKVSIAVVMDAIEHTYFQNPNGRGSIAYLIGYISTDLGVDAETWIRSLHTRLDEQEGITQEIDED